MNARWIATSLAAAVLLSVTALHIPAVSAGDYYSWIDENGTMVMTDDASKMPQAARRSPVQVHRFHDLSPNVARQPDADSSVPDEPSREQPAAMDPRSLDLPSVMLDEPSHQVRPQYVWVPLLSPLFVGGSSVNGFWWHPGATSPVEAFKQFLAQQYRQQRHAWTPAAGGVAPYSPGAARPSGNYAYDQTVRERQALEDSIRLRHFPNSPGPHQPAPRGGGGGHHSIRAR
jgi:hypothetical protein